MTFRRLILAAGGGAWDTFRVVRDIAVVQGVWDTLGAAPGGAMLVAFMLFNVFDDLRAADLRRDGRRLAAVGDDVWDRFQTFRAEVAGHAEKSGDRRRAEGIRREQRQMDRLRARHL